MHWPEQIKIKKILAYSMKISNNYYSKKFTSFLLAHLCMFFLFLYSPLSFRLTTLISGYLGDV